MRLSEVAKALVRFELRTPGIHYDTECAPDLRGMWWRSTAEVAQDFGVSTSTMRRWLRQLEALGVVESARDGRTLVWRAHWRYVALLYAACGRPAPPQY